MRRLMQCIFICIFLISFVLSISPTNGVADDQLEINTLLMNSTFRILGQGSAGTAFILGKQTPDQPERAYYVMITAAHVLEKMSGDTSTIILRKKDGDNYVKFALPLQIRKKGQPLWKKHPTEDIAVMYIRLPNDVIIHLLPIDLLATDEILNKYEIHPGDTLYCLGYPLGVESNEAGFPILRSGQIASYPILPTKNVKKISFNINVFEGNSGGPVYFVESFRYYAGAGHMGRFQFLFGLISEQLIREESVKTLREEVKRTHQLGVARVIHASLIRETLDLLPPRPEEITNQ